MIWFIFRAPSLSLDGKSLFSVKNKKFFMIKSFLCPFEHLLWTDKLILEGSGGSHGLVANELDCDIVIKLEL